MKRMNRCIFRAVESSQIILGFIECVKDLDLIINIIGSYGSVFEQGGCRENHEEDTTIV